MELKELLVVIPHSSIVIPGEIPLESLSERFEVAMWCCLAIFDCRLYLDGKLRLKYAMDLDYPELMDSVKSIGPSL